MSGIFTPTIRGTGFNFRLTPYNKNQYDNPSLDNITRAYQDDVATLKRLAEQADVLENMANEQPNPECPKRMLLMAELLAKMPANIRDAVREAELAYDESWRRVGWSSRYQVASGYFYFLVFLYTIKQIHDECISNSMPMTALPAKFEPNSALELLFYPLQYAVQLFILIPLQLLYLGPIQWLWNSTHPSPAALIFLFSFAPAAIGLLKDLALWVIVRSMMTSRSLGYLWRLWRVSLRRPNMDKDIECLLMLWNSSLSHRIFALSNSKTLFCLGLAIMVMMKMEGVYLNWGAPRVVRHLLRTESDERVVIMAFS